MKSNFLIISFLLMTSIFAYAKGDVRHDIELSSINMPEYISESTSEVFLSGTVKNSGTEPVTEFSVNYQINNGTVFTYTVTGINIPAKEEMTFVHDKSVVPSEFGEHEMKVWVTLPGEEFSENMKNSCSFPVRTYRDETARPRTTLIEVFTSSTCPPCNGSNVTLHNVLSQNKGRCSLIKNQVNWPAPGDPYYTAEGGVRVNFYNVNAAPTIYMDGAATGASNPTLINRQTVPAFMEMEIDYTVVGQTVNATVTVTPTIDMAATNLRLYIGIVEKETYNNYMNNGESKFYQVMKKYMPDANGIIVSAVPLEANQPIVFEQSWTFQGNYRKPTNASNPINHATEHSVENFDNLTIVAWVQNTSTRAVLQSCYPPPYTVNFNTIGSNGSVIATVGGNPIENGATIERGTEVTFIAEPNDWFAVKEWKDGEVVVPNNNTLEYVTTVDRTLNLSAEFSVSHFTVNFGTHSNQTLGTISAFVDDDEILTNTMVYRNSEVLFVATPFEGYMVRAWRLNGSIVATGTDTYVINNLTENANVTVEFWVSHFNVQFSKINNLGTIIATVDNEEIDINSMVPRSSRVVFTATPYEQCAVEEWQNNGNITNGQNLTFTIASLTASANVTVEFSTTLTHFDVNFEKANDFGTISASVNGTTIESGESVAAGARVVFTAEPTEGHRVKEWINNGTVIANNTTNQFVIETLGDFPNVIVEFEVAESGINKPQMSDINIYPNPVGDILRIVQKTADTARIEIYNFSGVLFKSSEINQKETELDVSSLNQGIYLIKIINNQSESVQSVLRFVKE